MRKYYQKQRLQWANLSFSEKMKLFKAWYIVTLIGNLCSIFGSIFVIFANYFPLGYSEIFIGLGAFCTWSSVTRYLANTEDFYVILRTFKTAIPTIAKVWVGILPIYIGVCFLSMTVLWEFKASFGSFTTGFYTMFSLQAGDALFDTYHSMSLANFMYAQIFMYMFIFFVISIVQPVFMVIVEDSYISIKYAKNFDWLDPAEPTADGDAKRGGGGDDDDDKPAPNQGAELSFFLNRQVKAEAVEDPNVSQKIDRKLSVLSDGSNPLRSSSQIADPASPQQRSKNNRNTRGRNIIRELLEEEQQELN